MTEKRLVWDLPTRLFHWLLALDILGLYLTAEPGTPTMEWHFRLGYVALGLVVFRIVWGFIGPRHARFSTFLTGPRALFRYLSHFFRRDSIAAPGHNPVGALMVIALLIMVGLQAISGLFTSDDIVFAGPYNGGVSSETANLMGSIHHRNFSILQWAILLHVLAVLFYLFFKRQNLIGAMFSGRKPAHVVSETEAISGSQVLKAVILALVVAGGVWWLIASAPPPAEITY
jgi:cytochrome b